MNYLTAKMCMLKEDFHNPPLRNPLYVPLFTYIHTFILQVNVKAAGKAAIHCAAVAGNIDVIKCLMEFSPNLEIEVRTYV